MKRIGSIICLTIIIMAGFTIMPAMEMVKAAPSELKVEDIAPKDKETGMALENMGFKVYFNKEVDDKVNRKANEKLCKITDDKGKEVPSIVVFDPKNKNVMMVLADTQNKKTNIKGKTEYKLTIENGFKADDGSTMGEYTSTFETLNPSTSMKISMGMMVLMFGGMIFFATKEKKREEGKTTTKKPAQKKVNPYKVAKETGKSVEEIVAKDEKRKEKEKAKAEKEKNKAKKNEIEVENNNMRVSRPQPISAAGLKYKEVEPKKTYKVSKSKKGGKAPNRKKKKK